MRRFGLVFLALALFSQAVCLVLADVPSVTDIQVESTTERNSVNITVRHNGPTSNHYVSRIEVRIGEDVEVFELDPQDAVTFTEEYEVTGEVVEVRAYCNLHGWSSWKEVESDTAEPPVSDEPSGGIPGFPLVAVGLGLAYVLSRDG